MKKFVISCFLVTPALLFAQSAQKIAPDFAVVKTKIDQTMQPISVTEALSECIHDPVCKGAIDAASTLVGVDSNAFTTALGLINHQNRGEESWTTIALPIDYEYCRMKISTISVVPATGDRASYMSVAAHPTSVGVYTWTPRQGLGKGRSWVEADFTVIGVGKWVADKYRAEGKCNSSKEHAVVSCRGASGTNHGQSACGNLND